MSATHLSDRESVSTQAILIAVSRPERTDDDVDRSLDELEHLAAGLGLHAMARVVQKRAQPAIATYLGEGKLREVALLTDGTGEVSRGPGAGRPSSPLRDDMVVVADDELTPAQIRNLTAALGVPVLDRTHVILRVFDARARTKEAKLQIELALLEYELPGVRDDHALGDQEGGGGRAARGHTNVALAKQRVRERMAAIRKELEGHRVVQDQQRRIRAEAFRVALVGYTNAGKSSLMRLLTGSDVLIENKLFATLGTTVRPLMPAAVPPVLIADTVGFLNRLPHGLVASFRATLAEATEALLLLEVVDASDPSFRTHLDVTARVLHEIGAAEIPTWIVLNKVDKLSHTAREALATEYPDALQISTLEPEHGRTLRKRLVDHFRTHLVEAHFSVPYADHGILASVRDQVRILHEAYRDRIEVTVAATPDVMGRLRKRLREAAG